MWEGGKGREGMGRREPRQARGGTERMGQRGGYGRRWRGTRKKLWGRNVDGDTGPDTSSGTIMWRVGRSDSAYLSSAEWRGRDGRDETGGMGRKRRGGGGVTVGWYGGDEMLIRRRLDGCEWMGWKERDDRGGTEGLEWEREIIRYGGGWIWRRRRGQLDERRK